VEQKCKDLQTKFENANQQKINLEQQIRHCELKMLTAKKLTEGLSGEKGRWESSTH
jgi:hypothetical protein